MATFKVGQRVRIVGGILGRRIGKTATVVGPLRSGICAQTEELISAYPLDVDGEGQVSEVGLIAYPPEFLAPLTDPDAWAKEQVAKLFDQPVLDEKLLEEIHGGMQ